MKNDIYIANIYKILVLTSRGNILSIIKPISLRLSRVLKRYTECT